MSAIAPGDEIIGLARGFFSAGAPSLLLTLWTVDDEATAEDEAEDNSESASDEKAAEVTAEAAEPESSAEEPEPTADEEPATEDDKTEDAPPDERPAQSTNGRLRNRRRRRVLGRVAVED